MMMSNGELSEDAMIANDTRCRDRRVIRRLRGAVMRSAVKVQGRVHTGGKRGEFELYFMQSSPEMNDDDHENYLRGGDEGVFVIKSRLAFSARIFGFATDQMQVVIDGKVVPCDAIVDEEEDGRVTVRIDAAVVDTVGGDDYAWFWLNVTA